MDEACASDDPPRRSRITVAHTRADRRWILRERGGFVRPALARSYDARPARRMSRPLPTRSAARSVAIQSGKPVNGRFATRTGVESAPRTPAARGERFVELTPLTPPAASSFFGLAGFWLGAACVVGCTVAAVVVVGVDWAPHCAASIFSPGEAGSFSRMSLRPSRAGCLVWPFSHALMLMLITTYGFVAEPVRWQMITL